jgi:hypothetical protein
MAVTDTVILLKRGSGKPDSLAYGEIALDTTAQIIYAGKLGGGVIEMSGGDIDWNQIDPDTLPPGLGGDNAINLTQLEARVTANEGSITTIEAELVSIWQELSKVSDIAEEALAATIVNATAIATNASDIADLRNEIDLIESSLIFGGVYTASSGKITQVDAYALDRGFVEGQTLTSTTTADQQGIYFICSEAGTVGILPGDDKDCQTGDWLIASGLSWTLVNYGFDVINIDSVVGLRGELDDLEDGIGDLEERVTSLETTIDCGSYTSTFTPNYKSA